MATPTTALNAISGRSVLINHDSHSLQITQYQLNGNNYREWSHTMLLVIKEENSVI